MASDTTSVLSVLGLLVEPRTSLSPAVQSVLARYGHIIALRAGVPSNDRCRGMIVLALNGPCCEVEALVADLKAVPGVTVAAANLA